MQSQRFFILIALLLSSALEAQYAISKNITVQNKTNEKVSILAQSASGCTLNVTLAPEQENSFSWPDPDCAKSLSFSLRVSHAQDKPVTKFHTKNMVQFPSGTLLQLGKYTNHSHFTITKDSQGFVITGKK